MHDEMTDSETAVLHNLLAKYCTQYAQPGEWSISERRAFTDLAGDLRESITDERITLEAFPNLGC
jgi:hypothetical protein